MKNTEKTIKYSIKQQFALIFIAVMVGSFGLCWIINNFFLEKYYIENKKSALENAYSQINSAVMNGDISSEEFDLEFRKICDMYNLSIIIIDSQSNTIKATARDTERLIKRLYDNFFDMNVVNKQILYEKDNYKVAQLLDRATDTEYLEMWGVFDSGNMFLIRTPLESIRESASIANKFLAYVAIVATVISAVIIWLVTMRITKPIMQITDISEKMTHLDFDSKYESKGRNEIDLLGEYINDLSATLENTISDLKTANNELQRDIEKKEKTDEMRKEFLANVSHELKTPIALIQGYAEGLKEGIDDGDPDTRDFYCDVIVDEADKMNRMVRKLLDLNQLEFGNDVISMERFDITALIRNFIQSANIIIDQNEVELKLQDSPPVFVWADEFKTEEVVRNYFSNAINHVKYDKIIEIKYCLISDEIGNRIRVSIFNTGDPIPEEAVEHIWEKFYKVDKARTREYGGSGVGLSIVKAIMESMNQQYGVINYTNGVEFWFELETK